MDPGAVLTLEGGDLLEWARLAGALLGSAAFGGILAAILGYRKDMFKARIDEQATRETAVREAAKTATAILNDALAILQRERAGDHATIAELKVDLADCRQEHRDASLAQQAAELRITQLEAWCFRQGIELPQ